MIRPRPLTRLTGKHRQSDDGSDRNLAIKSVTVSVVTLTASSDRIRSRLPSLQVNADTLRELGGFTGLGWTASILGYLGTLAGYGSVYLSRLINDPTSFLYAAGILFLMTLGLDQLATRLEENS